MLRFAVVLRPNEAGSVATRRHLVEWVYGPMLI